MLEKEFQYFLDNQEEFFEKYPNQFLVIKDEKVEGVFKDNIEAHSFGKEKFGLGNFLVQHCLPGDLGVSRTFHSQVEL